MVITLSAETYTNRPLLGPRLQQARYNDVLSPKQCSSRNNQSLSCSYSSGRVRDICFFLDISMQKLFQAVFPSKITSRLRRYAITLFYFRRRKKSEFDVPYVWSTTWSHRQSELANTSYAVAWACFVFSPTWRDLATSLTRLLRNA